MKEKIVKIGDVDVALKTSAYTPVLYSNLFGQNIFTEMQDIITTAGEQGTIPFSKVTVLYKLAYCMAKHADNSIKPFNEWLEQFDVYDIPEIAGDLIELWAADSKGQSTP